LHDNYTGTHAVEKVGLKEGQKILRIIWTLLSLQPHSWGSHMEVDSENKKRMGFVIMGVEAKRGLEKKTKGIF